MPDIPLNPDSTRRLNRWFLSLLIATVALALLPIAHIRYSAGEAWQGVMPEYIEDSTYYYARMNSICRGHFPPGNPYFIEHEDQLPAAFFLGDSLAALPLCAGLSLPATATFNTIFWSLITVGLLFVLARRFALSPRASAIVSFVVYLQVFWLFVRPVVMQTVFPAFILFLIALLDWLASDSVEQHNRHDWHLVLATALAVAMYTYLAQIAIVILVLALASLVYQRDRARVLRLCKIGFLAVLILAPFWIVTVSALHDPNYLESILRIGLKFTHLPRLDLYYYGRWVALVLVALAFARRYLQAPAYASKSGDLLVALSGVSLLVTAGSNIISGTELELANHIGRFMTLWFPLFMLILLSSTWPRLREFIRGSRFRIVILALFLLCLGGIMSRNVMRAFPFLRQPSHMQSEIKFVQAYDAPLEWLGANAKDKVVWADDRFATYIAMTTKAYVLFAPSAALELVSDRELEERYLISRRFSSTTLDSLVSDTRLYRVYAAFPNGYYDSLLERSHELRNMPLLESLELYNVQYVVRDMRVDPPIPPHDRAQLSLDYSDSQFEIYHVAN